ncbi:L,D-transpeptidase family protein [Thalassotalea sp. PLHSN55]|uniref:L,D-transpeptidase family protein n=1 Tax=Thalassotalea sp. PLHSN55 TaxID=3435888 RepID=UPI003F831B2C
MSLATVYDLPKENSRVIGEDIVHIAKKGDYFQALAEQYNVGFLALMAANPDIDPFLPAVGTAIVIPKKMLLPFIKKEGLVVNLAELRLYYFGDAQRVHVFPIGIGRQGLSTPQTISYISEKRKDPIWRPTKEMQARYFEEHGKEMAKEFPPGPDNPFGKYALRIGRSEYLLHGSNQRFGIGMRASSGCIRMYDDDIKWLYDNIALDTSIRIINQPIKMSYELNTRLIEIHQPLSPDEDDKHAQQLDLPKAVQKFVGDSQEQLSQANSALAQKTGLVTELSF